MKVTAAIILSLFGFCCTEAPADETKKVKYALVIHGGAGGVPSKEEWITNREKILNDALNTGTHLLKEGKSSLDVVETIVRILEDSEYFNAGKGAVFNSVEHHELDASIMDGRDRSCGAVGGVRTVKNPISLARRVMTETRHILLATDGAERFADQFKDDPKIERVSNEYFSTEHQRDRLKKTQKQAKQSERDKMGTVGCVALDVHGNIAAATSTGGLNNKQYGRIGDSPIVCAGTFADNDTCGVSCTGIGEDYMRNAVAYDVSARMAYRGDSLQKAVQEILTGKKHKVRGGIIAIDHDGNIVMEFNTAGMSRASADSTGHRLVVVGK